VSWDGHTVAGRLQFRVEAASGSGGPPVDLSSPPSSAPAGARSSLGDLWPVIVAVLLTAATAVAAWSLTTRRRRRPA
jgi:hypothetical protein